MLSLNLNILAATKNVNTNKATPKTKITTTKNTPTSKVENVTELKENISENQEFGCLFSKNGYIYFLWNAKDGTSDKATIWRMKPNGTEKKQIVKSNKIISLGLTRIFNYGNYVFFSNGDTNLYRINLDGTNHKNLGYVGYLQGVQNGLVQTYNWINNTLFTTLSNGSISKLYKIDLNTKKQTMLNNDCFDILLDNKNIYFSTDIGVTPIFA